LFLEEDLAQLEELAVVLRLLPSLSLTGNNV